MWAKLFWVARDYQLEQAYRVCIVEDKSVISMLEGALHFLNVISAAPDVDFRVLRILHAKTIACTFIMTLPAAMAFLEVFASFADRQADVLVIELCAV